MAITQPDFSLTEHLITQILVVFSGGQKKILFHAYCRADVDPPFHSRRKVNEGHKTGTLLNRVKQDRLKLTEFQTLNMCMG